MNPAPPVALILFSNDLDRFLPNLERERKAIEEALEHFDVSNRLKVITRSSVSIEEIFRLFARYRGRIVLFHFAGHATGEGLQLTRNFADQQLGQASGLAELFRMEVEQPEAMATDILRKPPDTRSEIDLSHVQVYLSELWDRALARDGTDDLPILDQALIQPEDDLQKGLNSFLLKQLKELDNSSGEGLPLPKLPRSPRSPCPLPT